jgi:hypothetical protein
MRLEFRIVAALSWLLFGWLIGWLVGPFVISFPGWLADYIRNSPICHEVALPFNFFLIFGLSFIFSIFVTHISIFTLSFWHTCFI